MDYLLGATFTLLLLLLGGCAMAPAPPSGMPENLQLRYEWVAGSMPPPHHYEYSISLSASGPGELVFSPDYPGDSIPTWRETFPISREDMEALYQLLLERDVLTHRWQEPEIPTVGGSYRWVEISAGEQQLKVPARLVEDDQALIAPVYEAIERLVPAAVWEQIRAQHEQYQRDYEQSN